MQQGGAGGEEGSPTHTISKISPIIKSGVLDFEMRLLCAIALTHGCERALPLVPAPRSPVPAMGLRESWQRYLDAPRLDAVREHVDAGRITAIESAEIDAIAGGGSSIYGEITDRGFSKLGKRLGIGPADRFADLGSGTGRAVVQAVTEFKVKAACGCELSPTRHGLAVAGQQELEPAVGGAITYTLADCCSALEWAEGGSLHETTVVWMCSPLFGRRTMLALGDRLAASSVRLVATMKPFVEVQGLGSSLEAFHLAFTEDLPNELCEMSWTAGDAAAGPGLPVHIYRRNETNSPSR